jgi:uncharacterized membrane protein
MKQTTKTQNILRVILGVFLTYAGISHLTFNRTAFLAQVPNWIPLNPDLVVVLSGVVEIGLGLALLFLHKKRRWIGIIVALFFILIFPGNIAQYVNKIDSFGLNTDGLRLARLFFQPLLVLWALWSTGGWSKLLSLLQRNTGECKVNSK